MARVYVGGLPVDIRERELDDLFYKYGRIRDIDIKRPIAPPAFAFITYDDSRGACFCTIRGASSCDLVFDHDFHVSFADASDAVYGRDGYNFDGCRLRCEIAKDSRGGYDRDRDRDGGRGGGGGGGDRRGGVGRRTDYGVVVSGLPKSCSWQVSASSYRTLDTGGLVYNCVSTSCVNTRVDGFDHKCARE